MIARNKKTGEISVVNLLRYTNINVLLFSEDIPTVVITFLDSTIESLHFGEKDQKSLIQLKFKGREEIILNNSIELNKYGGTLIFSAYYLELLDEYDRNDSIFITRNQNGITVENLSNILKRNDIKKSDAYQ